MDLEMVLNEASLRISASDIQQARTRMLDLVLCIQAATKQGVKKILRTYDDLNYIELAPAYPLARWRNDNEVDREARSFFRSLSVKYPYLLDVSTEIENRVMVSDFRYEDDKVVGLGIAFLLNALALSLGSELRWDTSHLNIVFEQLDDNGNMFEEDVEVMHASRREHVLEHRNWITARIKTGCRDGLELWTRRQELFPSLQFCEVVEKQLYALQTGHPLLHLVEKKLLELEETCQYWREHRGPFDHKNIPGRGGPESEPTLTMYGHERTFRCPDGQNRIFSLHVWVVRSWRIHYLPIENKREMLIGYIGKHLHTTSDPT